MSTVVAVVGLVGQDKRQVAPQAKSDSFAIDDNGRKIRVQNREVAGANFKIVGVDLAARAEVLDQASRILGKVETVATGDASTALERACYRPKDENDNTRVIFERGEVSPSFVLTSEDGAWKWKTPCRRTAKITRNIATASGLHLGQTQEQVVSILGLPTSRSRTTRNGLDFLNYELDVKKKMSPRELAPYLQDELKVTPNLDQKAWIKNYGYYALDESIHARFINDSLTNLEVGWSETY
jgi:hypothetical protein